jgi:citrate synthase
MAAHPSSDGPQMLTAAEAAERLGVKLGTLYAYVSRGWLKSYKRKVGRETLYRSADIEALRGVSMPERGRRARSLPDASSWVTIAQPRTDGTPSGVIVAESAVSSIAGAQLAYRGYPIEELFEHASFEEVCLLLWDGERPSREQTCALLAQLERIELSPTVERALAAIGDTAPPLLRLAAMMPAMAAADDNGSAAASRDRAPRIIGTMPLVLYPSDRERPPGSIAARLVSRGLPDASEWEIRAVSQILIACAEHELNASTFAARVVASTGADLYASVLAALCSLSGPIHGGACDRIERMFDALDSGVKLDLLLGDFSKRRLLPPGFGHAIYPNGDPRAALLKKLATAIARERDKRLLDIAIKIEESVWKRQRLRPNLDFYLTVCVRMLGFPPGLPAGIFALGRTAGWIAHSLEQYLDNRLIRPRMRYRGSSLRHWG